MVFLAHWLACLFHLVGQSDDEVLDLIKNSWIWFVGCEDEVWGYRYLNAFYWATVTMITLGKLHKIPKIY